MSKLAKRKAIDAVITCGTILTLYFSGAGWWCLVAGPFGLWNYHDGMTRRDLIDDALAQLREGK